MMHVGRRSSSSSYLVGWAPGGESTGQHVVVNCAVS